VSAPGQAQADADPRRWVSLAVVLVGAFMILLDVTIVNVAIPSMQVDLGASYGAIEWVVSGYALSYGLTLIPGGRLGDRFGYRRLFLLGMIGFVATSALCGVAQTPSQLVVARVAQGLFAGLLNPQVYAIIQVAFPPSERGKAYSAYGIVAGVSIAAGPLLGGLLLQADIAGSLWRPVFLINVPIGLVATILAARLLPASRGRGGSLDLVGITLVGAAILLVTVPLIEGREEDWPAWTWICFAAAVPVALLFVWWELRRGQDAVFDLRLFRMRSLSVGTAIGLAYFAGFIGLMFAVSLHLQLGLGRSPLNAGLILMAFAIGSMIGGGSSDVLHAKLGRGVILLGSALVIAGGVGTILTVQLAGAASSGAILVPALFVVGVGNGMTIAPNVDIALESVPPRESGSASGMVNTAQRIGNALGVAVVGVALFGALGSNAAAASGSVVDELRRDLAAAGQPAAAVDAGVNQFVRCYVTRSNASDPTVAPPGCPSGASGDPVSQIYAHAAARAQAENFTHATQRAGWWALVAIALTFLLGLLLPRRNIRVSPDPGVAVRT
jgi:EmrB/QacA subfamily drug resistance transporter